MRFNHGNFINEQILHDVMLVHEDFANITKVEKSLVELILKKKKTSI